MYDFPSSAFPAISLGFTILHIRPFFYPTKEVVIFHLHRLCWLGVFLLPTFTCLGQDFLSPCDGMHVCTDWTSVYILIEQSFLGNGSEPVLTPRDNPGYWKAPKRVETMMLHHAG